MELKPFFRFLQLYILLIRSVAPFAFAYLFLFLLSLLKWVPVYLDIFVLWETKTFFQWISFEMFNLWVLIEIGFYFYYAYTLRRFQTRRPPNHSLNPITRRQLVKDCFKALSIGHSDLQKVFEEWFQGAPFKTILRGNFESWIAWAFFDKDPSELDQDEKEELSQLLVLAEEAFKYKFPEGYNPNVHCMRLTIDPVHAMHRPLIYYGWIQLFQGLGKIILLSLGFRKKKFPNSVHNFWYRPSERPTSEQPGVPIVFVHGIGIGFIPYLGLLYHFPRSVPCYLLEWRHVSMKLTERVPSISETVTGITQMLEADGHKGACFIAHSLGTTAVTWMIRERPELVTSTVLLDPITILLCEPTVCNNFVYRKPTTCVELLMNYLVSRELYIAHAISRHFAWCRNILFTHQLPKGGASIFLGGADSIVPGHPIARYLQKTIPKYPESDIDLHFYEGKEHGEVMLRPNILKVVVATIHKRIQSPHTIKLQSERAHTKDEHKMGG